MAMGGRGWWRGAGMVRGQQQRPAKKALAWTTPRWEEMTPLGESCTQYGRDEPSAGKTNPLGESSQGRLSGGVQALRSVTGPPLMPEGLEEIWGYSTGQSTGAKADEKRQDYNLRRQDYQDNTYGSQRS